MRREIRLTLIEARTEFVDFSPRWIVSSGMGARLWSLQVKVRKGGVGGPDAKQRCRPLPAKGIRPLVDCLVA